MQRLVDHVLAVAKESVKTFTYESLNNVVRLINGISALVLAILPGKTTILEGIQGWELRPTFRGPRLPRWMENGDSSFNQLIRDLCKDSDTSSSEDYMSAEDDNDDANVPVIPLSESSCLSQATSLAEYKTCQMHWTRCLFSWMLWPAVLLAGIPVRVFDFSCFRKSTTVSSTSDDDQPSNLRPSSRSNLIKDHMFSRTTDRRRGVVEDLQLSMEISIEAVFDTVHKVAYYLLSPSEAFRILFRWLSSHFSRNHKGSDGEVSVLTATLGDVDPSPNEKQTTFQQSLNTDARTCQDVITELGYPYEAIQVVTSDGYVLLLERIPRRDSKKVVFLQHGILDSAMGWVSNGVVGSPAFAAFDQGYDVFLGNLRGLVSREHIDKNISTWKYWNYSVNEHGTQDMPALINSIHEIKTSEMKLNQSDLNEEQPYKLCAICHSLGGAVMLMYVITRRLEKKPHRLSRMILLSPAGFHEDGTFTFTVAEHVVLAMAPILARIMPALYIPTRFFRMLVHKLARDFHNYPALGGLVQTLLSYFVGGDSSNWVGAIGMPHYNMNNMPGISFHVGHHLVQMKHARKFIMYDYGSAAANMEAYGSPKPLDLGQHYGLIDVPVNLVAGRKDRVIPSAMVRRHYELMRGQGVEASYEEYEYAHLDFTFSHSEELLGYIMSCLLLAVPCHMRSTPVQTEIELKKADAEELANFSSKDSHPSWDDIEKLRKEQVKT